MAMTIKTQVAQETGTLSLEGRFDFNVQRDFRQGYESLLHQPGVTRVELDLRGVDYIDSSALGMLLVLKEVMEKSRQQLTITNCTDPVRKVLDVANFGRLFVLV